MSQSLSIDARYDVRGSVSSASRSSTIDVQVMLFVLLFFVPDKVGVQVGALLITPLRLLGMILLPQLIFRHAIRWAWPDHIMLAFFAIEAVSFLLTGDSFRAVESVGRHFLDAGMPYLVARYAAQDKRLISRILCMVVTLLSILVATVLLESLWRVNIHQRFWGMFAPVGGIYDEQRMGITRAMGWTSHPIMLGLFYASFLPVAFYAAVYRTNLVGSWAWLKVAALLAGVFLSVSSTAWLAAAIVIALYAWEWVKGFSVREKWQIAFIGAPLAYIVLEVLSNRPLMRIMMMKFHLANPNAWWYRWMLRERVLAEMPGHWLLGHGLKTPEAFQQVVGWSIDNHYLVVLLLTGGLGLVTWIGCMASVVFYRANVVWFSADTETTRFARAVRFTVIALALSQISVAMFSTAAVVLWFLMGVSVGAAEATSRVVTQARRRERVDESRRYLEP